MHSVYLNSIATAVPSTEVHGLFLDSLEKWMPDPARVQKLQSIGRQAQIDRRYSVLEHPLGPPGSGAFYQYGQFPSTQQRMQAYQRHALPLAKTAVERLMAKLGPAWEPQKITHLILTSCTGFYAPGLDVELVRDLGLPLNIKRTLIGFMGCQAGLTGLRVAREIVLGQPHAQVLMVNVELCSLHLQETEMLDRLVSFILFADGAAASLITSQPLPGSLLLEQADSQLSLEDAERMAWVIEDSGFAMTLDSRLPVRIRQFLSKPYAQASFGPWAVHPGGKAILDAVEQSCSLSRAQMQASRAVLQNYGNMSSASVLFVLELVQEQHFESALEGADSGCAIAFGPGLTVEMCRYVKVF